jgi:hypothetical protein
MPPSMTKSAPAPNALATSPGQVPVQNVTSFGFGKDRSRTPAVANDKAAQTVRGICALNHSRQLGVADASQLARGANL